MDFENIFPLIILWLIWVISQKRQGRGRQEKPAPRSVPAPMAMAPTGPPPGPPTFAAAVEMAPGASAAKARPALSENRSAAGPPAWPDPAADSSVGTLRQAVVWSEILAPPLALRK